MKPSWNDLCSSDDDSEGEYRRKSKAVNEEEEEDTGKNLVPSAVNKPEENIPESQGHNNNNNNNDDIPFPLPLADFSANYPQFHESFQDMQGPSYSAVIRNLSYTIRTNDNLSRTIEGLVDYRYHGEQKVHVSSSWIIQDRETKKSKGMAYINFETLDEV